MTEPIRPIALKEIEQARARIAGTILRTPLVRLEQGKNAPDIRLKLENLQVTGAFKERGAANRLALLQALLREFTTIADFSEIVTGSSM